MIDVAADGQSAQGRWLTLIMSGVWHQRANWGLGPYENTYVKEHGVWKIKSVHWYEILIVPYADGWGVQLKHPHDGRFVTDLQPDAPPTERYAVWPGVYLPPFHYRNPVTGK